MDIDVEQVMLRLAETQKEYVRTDLEDYGAAMVVVFRAQNSSYLQFPKFEDWETKQAEYSAVVERAKRENATLIITVNNARTGASKDPDELDAYQWGDLDSANSGRCILLTASGPGLKNCSLEIGYSIADKQVSFQEPEWMFEVELNLLPGWPVGWHG